MITVFTSCWNQGEFLQEAIDSVLAQTYTDFEYLLFDDGSTDNTNKIMWDTVTKVNVNEKIRFFPKDKQPNVATVINESIREMKGDTWVWCPSDDMLSPHLLEEKIKWSREYPDCVLYSDWSVINAKGKFMKNIILPDITPEIFAKKIFTSCPIGCTGIWIPKSVFDKVGVFDETVDCSEDYDWVLKAVSAGVRFVKIPKILYCKRHSENRNTERVKRDLPAIVKEIRGKYND